MEKKTKKSLLDDKWVLRLFSVGLALLAWFVVTNFVVSGATGTIRGARINYARDDAGYLDGTLAMVGELTEKVNVRVRSNGRTVNMLTASDVVVYPDYSMVDGPGVYELSLKATPRTSGSFDVLDIEPKTVTVEFQTVEVRTLTLTGQASRVTAAEGFFRDSLVVSPGVIEISGPASAMAKLDSAVAIVKDEEVRQATKHYSGVPVTLLDVNGNELDKSLYTLSVASVEVTVPVLEVRELPITVGFTGVPDGFDLEWLKSIMHISPKNTIKVAGESAVFDSITEYEVGRIDLSEFKFGDETYVFQVQLRKELKNYEQLKEVSVSFDTSGMAQRSFAVSNIQVINPPAGMSITPVEYRIQNVVLVGPADEIAALLNENIILEVDAFGLVASQSGQQTLAARVLVPKSHRIFALGTYQVVCDVKLL